MPPLDRGGYDGATGRRTMLAYPYCAQVGLSYGPRGEVAAQTLDRREVARFRCDLERRRVAVTRANGVVTTTTTDPAGQLLSVFHVLGSITRASTAYELDAAGRRTPETGEAVWTECYGYDATGQLTSPEYLGSPVACQLECGAEYAYDAHGNRERVAEVTRAQGAAPRTTLTHYSANSLNQDTAGRITDPNTNPPTAKLAYDANGNLRQAQGVGYRYNVRNQLIEVMTTNDRMTQIHDPKGRVIERRYFTRGLQGQWIEDATRSLRLVHDAAWNVIEDRDLRGQLRARYVHGPKIDEILLREGSDGAKLYPLADGLGSTVALTNAGGSVTQRYRYDAYGTPAAFDAALRHDSRPSVGPVSVSDGVAWLRHTCPQRQVRAVGCGRDAVRGVRAALEVRRIWDRRVVRRGWTYHELSNDATRLD